jgi:hypothetical protein
MTSQAPYRFAGAELAAADRHLIGSFSGLRVAVHVPYLPPSPAQRRAMNLPSRCRVQARLGTATTALRWGRGPQPRDGKIKSVDPSLTQLPQFGLNNMYYQWFAVDFEF